MNNFIDDCLAGKASVSDLDDYIEYWHTHETGNTLQEFLGVTEAEYGQWLKMGDYSFFQSILEQRKAAISKVK